MPQPFDYSLKIQSPGEAFLQAVQVGQQQQQVEAQRLRAETERKKLEEEAARAKNFQADVTAWTKNPTPEGWRELVGKYSSDFIQQLSGVQKAIGDVDRPIMRSLANDALLAHRNKKPEVVVSLIDKRIEAAADNPALVKKLQDMKQTYQDYSNNPELQESMIASVLGQDEEGRGMYSTAFKQTDPFIVAGNNVYSRSELKRALDNSERTGDPNVTLTPVIPADALDDLKAGRVTPAGFDKVFGPGAAAKAMGTVGISSGNAPVPPSKTITESEAARMRKALGGSGFVNWLRENNIAIVGK